MSFDPRALRNFVQSRPGASQPQPRAVSKKRGKKRPRDQEPNLTGLGESSQPRPHVQSPQVPRSPTPPLPQARVHPETIDLDDDETIPEGLAGSRDVGEHPLFTGLVVKYSKEVKLDEGVKVLELLSKKALSVARGLAIQGLEESRKLADLEDSSALKDRRIADLEADREALRKELGVAKQEARKALEEIGVAKDEAEELRLELLRKEQEFEHRLEDGKKEAKEEFKTSEECDKLKGEYASGAYFHAYKEARAYLRSKHPEIDVGELKTVPSMADSLELSDSEDGGGGDDGDEVEGDDVEIDITNLDPPLGQIG